MADAPQNTPTKKGGKLGFFTLMIACGLAAPFIFPTLVLVGLTMIPTFVAALIDKDADHATTTSVGAMNVAGVTPFLIDLWLNGQNMTHAFQILLQANTWLVVLSAAAIGRVIVAVIPQALATLTLVHTETRVKHLKGNLEKLKESWGSDVGSTKSLDQLTRRD